MNNKKENTDAVRQILRKLIKEEINKKCSREYDEPALYRNECIINKKINKIKKILYDKNIKESDRTNKIISILDEISNSASIAGYQTPYAFSKKKKRFEDTQVLDGDLAPQKKIQIFVKRIVSYLEEIEKLLNKSAVYKQKEKLNYSDLYKVTQGNIQKISPLLTKLLNKIQTLK